MKVSTVKPQPTNYGNRAHSLAGAVVIGELWDGGECESATQHALQPLHPTLHWAQAGPDESSVIRKAHPLSFSRPAYSPSWHTVCTL